MVLGICCRIFVNICQICRESLGGKEDKLWAYFYEVCQLNVYTR